MRVCSWAPFLKECYDYGEIHLSRGDIMFLVIIGSWLVAVIIHAFDGRFK